MMKHYDTAFYCWQDNKERYGCVRCTNLSQGYWFDEVDKEIQTVRQKIKKIFEDTIAGLSWSAKQGNVVAADELVIVNEIYTAVMTEFPEEDDER